MAVCACVVCVCVWGGGGGGGGSDACLYTYSVYACMRVLLDIILVSILSVHGVPSKW